MYSETIVPTSEKIEISIPKSYINKKLHISIIPISPKSEKSKFAKYFGVMKIENIDYEIEDIRNQWERNIIS
jgi:hypothetical protein